MTQATTSADEVGSIEDLLEEHLTHMNRAREMIDQFAARHPEAPGIDKCREVVDNLSKKIVAIDAPENLSLGQILDIEQGSKEALVLSFATVANQDPELIVTLMRDQASQTLPPDNTGSSEK